VKAVETGAEALAMLSGDETFDVAILDMQMPGMDGSMLAIEIRKLRSADQMPLVLLSSLGDREAVPSHQKLVPVRVARLLELDVDRGDRHAVGAELAREIAASAADFEDARAVAHLIADIAILLEDAEVGRARPLRHRPHRAGRSHRTDCKPAARARQEPFA